TRKYTGQDARRTRESAVAALEKDMATAIIGLRNIGGTCARARARGGEEVVLSATTPDKVTRLAGEIGAGATPAGSNREAVQGADAVVLALWLDTMRAVIEGGCGFLS